MVGWNHQINGHEFEQTLGDGEGQEGVACCNPWVTESDMTEELNNNNHYFRCFMFITDLNLYNYPMK